MKLAVFGGTGPTGRELIARALSKGHEVTALARSPQKLTAGPRLTVVRATLDDTAGIGHTLDGADAALSLLGPNSFRVTGTPIASGTRLIIKAMRERGIKRLIAIATPSAPDPEDSPSLKFRFMVGLVKRLGRSAYDDIVATAQAIRASDVNWTIVRVGLLTDAPATGEVAAGPVVAGRNARIARADVADFMLNALSSLEWLCKAPFISGP